MDVPEIAIRWIVECAASNLQLAYYSNVSRRWRSVAMEVVLDQGRKALDSEQEDHANDLLLLPSMVRFLLCQQTSIDNAAETFCIAWFAPEGMDIIQVSGEGSGDSSDDIDEDEEIVARRQRSVSPEPFAPGGGQLYAGSEEERKQYSRRQRVRSKSPMAFSTPAIRAIEAKNDTICCMKQWRGYRDAMEVLRPFGYARKFVDVSRRTF